AYVSAWNHSFARLFALIRSACWKELDLMDLLESCGTAGGQLEPPLSMQCNVAEAFLLGG
ncbi:MAG: IS4 family transposase, partial [Verrucomicrobiota bacterium]|nr:IS4 family transposase [Verrucomicrobiota bacterium]